MNLLSHRTSRENPEPVRWFSHGAFCLTSAKQHFLGVHEKRNYSGFKHVSHQNKFLFPVVHVLLGVSSYFIYCGQERQEQGGEKTSWAHPPCGQGWEVQAFDLLEGYSRCYSKNIRGSWLSDLFLGVVHIRAFRGQHEHGFREEGTTRWVASPEATLCYFEEGMEK